MISQGFLGNLGSIKSTPQSYVQAYLEVQKTVVRLQNTAGKSILTSCPSLARHLHPTVTVNTSRKATGGLSDYQMPFDPHILQCEP